MDKSQNIIYGIQQVRRNTGQWLAPILKVIWIYKYL